MLFVLSADRPLTASDSSWFQWLIVCLCPSCFLPQVLFVLSADRPLTESEVRFLQYVRQWGKKVVFVVNKVSQGLSWAPPASSAAAS